MRLSSPAVKEANKRLNPNVQVRYGYARDTKLFYVVVFTTDIMSAFKSPDSKNYIREFRNDTQVDDFVNKLTLDNYEDTTIRN